MKLLQSLFNPFPHLDKKRADVARNRVTPRRPVAPILTPPAKARVSLLEFAQGFLDYQHLIWYLIRRRAIVLFRGVCAAAKVVIWTILDP